MGCNHVPQATRPDVRTMRVRRFELPASNLASSRSIHLSYTHKTKNNAGRRIRTFRLQFLRLPRLPIAPYLLVVNMRTRGLEPPTTAFSGLRVCRLRHVRNKSIGRDSNSRPQVSETCALWFQLSYRCERTDAGGRIRTCILQVLSLARLPNCATPAYRTLTEGQGIEP